VPAAQNLAQHGAQHPESGLVIVEYLLDPESEHPRDPERERQAGIVFAGLDGVDRLARDLKALGEIGLAPIASRAQDFEAVVHRRHHAPMPCAKPTALTKMRNGYIGGIGATLANSSRKPHVVMMATANPAPQMNASTRMKRWYSSSSSER